MKRLALGFASIALLFCCAWWFLSGKSASSEAAVAAESRDAKTHQPVVEQPATVAAPEDQRASVPQPAVEPEPATAPAVVKALSDGERTLSGTVVVVDELGVEHPSESGKFDFVLWRGDLGWHQRVEVLAGRWTTTIPEPEWPDHISLAEIVLGNRRAVPIEAGDIRWSPRDPALLVQRVRWPQASRLFVRDAATGAELEDVQLVAVEAWPLSDLAHPGDAAREAVACGRSPVDIPQALLAGFGSRVVFARSAGHAWGRVEIDTDRGGDRIVMLESGGDLDVQIVGVVEDPNLVLRIYREGYQPLVQFRLDERRKTIEIAGLSPGKCRLAAQIGDYWSNPLELGTVQAVVEANRRTSAVLTLEALVRSPKVPLSGTLVLPAAWEMNDFALNFELKGTALGGGDGTFRIERSKLQRSAEPDTYMWKAPDVQVGRYEVQVSRLAFSMMLDVRAPGLTDARIEVPPPAAVTVRCVDEQSGEELGGATVTWHFELPEGVDGWSLESADWNAAGHCFAFRAPIGTVEIQAMNPDHAWTMKEFQIVAGDNALVMRLPRQCSLRVILRDGDTQIPIGPELEIALVAAEGQDSTDSRSWSGGTLTMHRGKPGLYSLHVPPISGFEPVPDATVSLESGRVIEHVVQLVRKH